MARKKNEGIQYTETVCVTPSGVHAVIRHPILTPEERERRMKRVEAAMFRLYEHCMENGIPWPSDDDTE